MLGTGISFNSGLLLVLLGLLAVAGAGPYCLIERCPGCATESQDLWVDRLLAPQGNKTTSSDRAVARCCRLYASRSI